MQPMMTERFRNRQTAALRSGYGTGYGGGYGRRYGGYGGLGTGYGNETETRPLVPVITPSDQTNTLIVRGSKKDRAEIEEIINRLDVPDPIYEPVRVPILNAELARVMQQFIAVYGRRIQLTRLPGGAQVQVMSEPATNSIIIQAPEDMSKEFADYIRGLDEKIPSEPTRKIHVVQLEKINSNMVQFAIQQLYSKYNMSYGYGSYGGAYPATGYYPAPAAYGTYGGGYAVPGYYGRTPY
jgi:type II secretory pathway component GspD/PulD (secretin)